MVESIKELRGICQKQESELVALDLTRVYQKLVRRPSIYLTKLFLILGISANWVTFIDLLMGLIAGVLLTFANPAYWILAVPVLHLTLIIDCCDGEVARYNRTASKVGTYLDAINGIFIWTLYIPVCMSLGIYRALQSPEALIAGILVLVSIFLLDTSGALAYRIFGKSSSPADEFHTSKTAKGKLAFVLWLGYSLLTYQGLVLAILVVSLIDLFLPPAIIGFFTLNARFGYFMLYGLAMLIGAILRIYYILREGNKNSSMLS